MILFQFVKFIVQLKYPTAGLTYNKRNDGWSDVTSFSASFNSASFSFTRATNICRISSSFCCNSCKWMDRFASHVCWKLTGLLSLSTSLKPIWKNLSVNNKEAKRNVNFTKFPNKMHLFQSSFTVELVVATMRFLAHVLHVGAYQHLA